MTATQAEILANVRNKALTEALEIAEREPNKYAIAACIRRLIENDDLPAEYWSAGPGGNTASIR